MSVTRALSASSRARPKSSARSRVRLNRWGWNTRREAAAAGPLPARAPTPRERPAALPRPRSGGGRSRPRRSLPANSRRARSAGGRPRSRKALERPFRRQCERTEATRARVDDLEAHAGGSGLEVAGPQVRLRVEAVGHDAPVREAGQHVPHVQIVDAGDDLTEEGKPGWRSARRRPLMSARSR